MSLPIVMAAPHAMSEIQGDLRDRISLNDYEIWKCSDPFTGELSHFTCAKYKHVADVNRLVVDYNRAPNTTDAFRDRDFFGRTVFKEDQELGICEKEAHLDRFWHPFHDHIAESVKKLDDGKNDVILIVDYHNTAGDHALNQDHEYMPSFVLSNLGLEHTGEKDDHHPVISIAPKYMAALRDEIQEELDVAVEINTVYHGGYDLYWFAHLENILKTRAKIVAVQIEYNLDYVFNPISRYFDRKALDIMQKGLNKALTSLYEQLAANYHKKAKRKK